MKLLIKILLALFGLLIVLIVSLVVLLAIGIDAVAKTAIEEGGTYALEVDTTVDKADVGMFSGDLTITGLEVANPAGFSAPHFVTLDDAYAAVDTNSFAETTVLIPEVSLTGIDMHMQRTGEGSNYQTILDSLKRLESGEAPPPADSGEEPPAAVIETLTISDITVHLDLLPMPGPLAVLTEATQLEIQVDEIVLNNVGGEEPVPMTELAGVALKAIFQAVLAKAGSVLPDGALGDLSGSLSQLESLGDLGAEFSGELAEELNAAIGQAGEAVGQATEQLENAVGEGVEQLNEIGNDLTDNLRNINPFGGGNDDGENEGEGGGG